MTPGNRRIRREVPTPADQFREIRGRPPLTLRELGRGFSFLMITIRVPATIANLGPAFDVLALAVSLHNTVEATRAEAPWVEVHGEGEGILPADSSNLVYRAATAVAERVGERTAFALRCRNRIPLARGLGSSAAATVAGAAAANALLGRPLGPDDLLDLAASMEGHPDNVAAALHGGVVLSGLAAGRVLWTRLEPQLDAALVAVIPEFTVATAAARAVLPAQVPFRDAVANLAHATWLVAALLTGRRELLAHALDDALHQPYRAVLVPGLPEVIAAARAAGAFGAVLSGSGPTIVALAPRERAPAVGAAMLQAYERHGIRAAPVTLELDREGTQIMEGGAA